MPSSSAASAVLERISMQKESTSGEDTCRGPPPSLLLSLSIYVCVYIHMYEVHLSKWLHLLHSTDDAIGNCFLELCDVHSPFLLCPSLLPLLLPPLLPPLLLQSAVVPLPHHLRHQGASKAAHVSHWQQGPADGQYRTQGPVPAKPV